MSSSSSESDDNANVSVAEYESDEEEWTEHCMYGNEPEYSAQEMLAMAVDESQESSGTDSDDSYNSMLDLDSSRMENLHWCRCTNCDVMDTLQECRCCKEFQELLVDDKFESINCITEHPHFNDICLQTHVLEAAYMQNRRYNNRYNIVNTTC